MRHLTIRQLITVLAGLLAATACGAPQDGATTEDCTSFDRQAEAVWNAQVQDDLDFPVRVLEGEIDAADAEHVITRLNHFSSNWVRLRSGACRDHHEHGTLDEHQYRERVACLEKNLDSESAVISAALNDPGSMRGELEVLFEKLRECVPEDTGTDLEVRGNPFAAE